MFEYDRRIEEGLKENKTKHADNIYYNVQFSNTDYNKTSIQAVYYDKRISSILKKPNDYMLSIERFKITIQEIPITVFKENIWYIGFQFRGVNYPAIPTAAEYNPNTTINPKFVQYISSGTSAFGRSIYHIQQFVDMVNAQLKSAYQACATANPVDVGFGYLFDISNPLDPLYQYNLRYVPRIYYDDTTSLFSFRVPQFYTNVGVNAFYATIGANPPVTPLLDPKVLQIIINHPLSHILYTQKYGLSTAQSPLYSVRGQYYVVLIKDETINETIFIGTPNPNIAYWNMSTESSTINVLNTLSTIIFTSNNLGVRGELLSPSAGDIQSGNDNSLSILTDFELTTSVSDVKDRGYAQFTVSGARRWVDLPSNDEIQTLTINAFFSDTAGDIFPLTIGSGQTWSMKLLFRRKSLIGLDY